MSKKMNLLITTSLALLVAPSLALAVDVGFSETFDADVAGWEDNVNNPLGWVSTGGADGGGYASTTFNFLGYTNPFGGDGGPVTFRASFSDNASGGAFVGDWLTEGVGAIQMSFRHDAPEPLTLYLRVATRFNFPGAVLDQPVAVPSGAWTDVVIPINPFSPACTPEGYPNCAAAFSAVETFQIGVNASAGLIDDDFAYTLDLDRVTILPIPEPGTALLMGLGLAGLSLGARREEKD